MFCLSHWDLPNHNTLHCALGTIGKPLMNTCASRYFVMFRPMVKDLLNIEQKTEMFFFFQIIEIQEALVLLESS